MEQRRLPGIGQARPAVSHHVFFALVPDDDVRARIAATAQQLKRQLAPRGRWINPDRYHLTLRYLGQHESPPPELIDAACAAADAVRASAFAFALDIAASFPNRRIPWWIGCSELTPELAALWRGISARLDEFGIAPPAEAEAVAHITILRDADTALPATPIAPIEWTARDFVLIDSRLGPDPQHTVLRRWTLRG